jgi:hypothetical protein
MFDEQIIPYFFAFWLVLGISGSVYFFREKNIIRKTRNVKWGYILSAAIFFLFCAYMMRKTPALIPIIALAIGIITVLNLKFTTVCQHCGAFINKLQAFGKTKFCPKCGTSLEKANG